MNPDTYTPATPRKRPSLILIIMAVAAIIFIILAVHTFISQSRTTGSISVAVHALPTNAKVLIDGKRVGSTAHLDPGTYTVQASAPGFADYKLTYSVSRSINDPVLVITLSANSAAGRDYLSRNQKLYSDQEVFGGIQAHQQSSFTLSESPLITQLPYTNLVYTISYHADPKDSSGRAVIITISAPTGYRNAAIEKIRSLGYNPADYTIVFNNYTNPFTP